MSRTTQTISLAKRFYVPRTIGLSLGFPAVFVSLPGPHAPPSMLALLVLYCFAWPHLAYQLARRNSRPVSVERRNMLVDTFAAGFFAGAIGFNPIPSAAIVTMPCMNNMAMGGPRFMMAGVLASASGGALAYALFRTPFDIAMGTLQVAACTPLLVLYPLSLGYVCYLGAVKLQRQKQQLSEMSRTDYLTGLANRAALNDILDTSFSAPNASLENSVIALIDADGFKRINDRYGHIAGDRALQKISDIMRACVRKQDTVGRYGGDEFCVILRDVTTAEAAAVLERMRALAQQSIDEDGGEQRSTLSIGAAMYSAAALNGAMWIQRADEAMYDAKRAGRNKVVFAAWSAAGRPSERPLRHPGYTT
ncbi:sensor domain-containing diguanylate cyclase [Massilia sp. 9096]|uniref:sensor domain-containing diguanylate cyclase n=1 Tax=Massilia sp. 9096 TaxID=1500894 RepID=UPI00068EACF6|nr:sensor domain-containing diguanylate cyclase [Massilia sp. 9096]